ncbi:GntP family permease [Thermoactinomyces sp. CICC 10523]|uniref:GntP family permease n=1 Tax=Thermoactinomyces sp. CICC 10523 TaxID=2767428 RepID=UPI0018DCDE5A|nr:GntP family permease [Thermoactinomyces sp. CICC 10523]MBH8596527.1 GntP family permease [Thermoactinomyces sp. CICC 10523]
MLLVVIFVAIVALLLMITWLKLNPFISLIITAVGVGLAAGMPLDKVIDSIKTGLGNTLGFIAIVLAFGTMLGKMMAESGGAERIAQTLIKRFGQKNIHWAMMFVAFIVGIPVFFQVGFVLLIPLVFTIAVETGMSLVPIGLSLVAGLSIVHGIVPPHPAAMATVGIFKADTGLTILYALIVGLPAAMIAGPLYGKWIGKRIHKTVPESMAKQLVTREQKELPGFGNTIFTIILPVILMLLSTFADLWISAGSQLHRILKFIGDPVVALLLATLYSFVSLGKLRGFNRDLILKFSNDCLAPTASILLVIGGGGAFNKVLLDSGVGDSIADVAKHSHLSPILLAWLVAALIRVSTGSATVAMLTSAGIVAPIAAAIPGTSPELLVLATGAGSLILSHVNDSGFWMIKEYFGMSVKETLLTWTVMETILSVVGLIITLLLSLVV